MGEFKRNVTRGCNRDLSFYEDVPSFCKEADRKLSFLSKLSNVISFQQRRLLMKSFVEAQFGYCPLVWMSLGREIKINLFIYLFFL